MFRLLTLLLAVLALPRLADACSCVALLPSERYAKADAVFLGDVVEVTEVPRRKTVTLTVTRAYKGGMKAGETVTVVMPGGSSASCSLDVAKGARLVIYGRMDAGTVRTNLCQGSYRLQPGAPLPDLPPPA